MSCRYMVRGDYKPTMETIGYTNIVYCYYHRDYVDEDDCLACPNMEESP